MKYLLKRSDCLAFGGGDVDMSNASAGQFYVTEIGSILEYIESDESIKARGGKSIYPFKHSLRLVCLFGGHFMEERDFRINCMDNGMTIMRDFNLKIDGLPEMHIVGVLPNNVRPEDIEFEYKPKPKK